LRSLLQLMMQRLCLQVLPMLGLQRMMQLLWLIGWRRWHTIGVRSPVRFAALSESSRCRSGAAVAASTFVS
jgi:hypothetical protein